MFGNLFKKNKNTYIEDDELTLDTYDGDLYDLDRDEVFYSEDTNEVETDNTDYTDFNKVEVYDSTEDDLYDKSLKEEKVEKKTTKKESFGDYYEFGTLYTVAKWVKIIGIFLMIVCIAYYLSVGSIKSLLIYIISLAVAYFIGYGFMYIITSNK